MLLGLHIKNLALIEKVDVEFGEGLDILTGETGAGKSITIGFVAMALGGRAPKGSIRPGADYAYTELVFSVTGEKKRKALRKPDMEPTEDGLVIVSRKLTSARSISRINDKTVTMARLSQTTGLLLDIHRQHEHRSLLYKSKHLEILDAYVKAATQPVKQTIADRYRIYRSLEEKLGEFDLDTESRIREADFLRFEIEEIEASALREGEEKELTSVYRRYSHSRRITGCLGAAYEAMEGDWPARALKEVEQVSEYDGSLGGVRDRLYDADSILRGAGREMSAYLDSMEMDEEALRKTEECLDLIRNLQAKYGSTVEAIFQKLEQKKKRLGELKDHDAYKKRIERESKECRNGLKRLYTQLTGICKKASRTLVKKIRQGLVDLNFLDMRFDMEFEKLDRFTPSGWDGAQFLISTNPGQPMRPLMDVVPGGELSRIMLAIKTVLADSDDIPTLIFDEIDTGINGRTAQKVSEKLMLIARSYQVIRVTHLSQIAVMADSHFEIAKSASQGRTITTIRLLDGQASVEELARLLGGTRITEAVFKNIGEMRGLADRTK